MKPLVLVLVAMLAISAACSDGGASSSPTARHDAAPDLDPNLFTAIVLQPTDLPPGYVPEEAFNPPGSSATAFHVAYRLNGVSISSNIVRYTDNAARDKDLSNTRGGFTQVIGPETVYQFAGADAAFLYSDGKLPAQATIIVQGRYVVTVALQTQNTQQPAAVTNRADLDRYSALVFGRLQQILADPSSATPIAGAPTFDAQRSGPIVITATP